MRPAAGAGADGWFKVYSSGANSWSWSTSTSDNDAHQIYARFDAPGVYDVLISARSRQSSSTNDQPNVSPRMPDAMKRNDPDKVIGELAKQQTAFSEERTEFSQERTEFSAFRTAMSTERTYTSWVRTGLAALVSGLAVLRFMHDVMSGPSLRLVAVTFIAFSLFCFGAGVWRYWRTGQMLDRLSARRISTIVLMLATMLLVAAGLVALAATWTLQG